MLQVEDVQEGLDGGDPCCQGATLCMIIIAVFLIQALISVDASNLLTPGCEEVQGLAEENIRFHEMILDRSGIGDGTGLTDGEPKAGALHAQICSIAPVLPPHSLLSCHSPAEVRTTDLSNIITLCVPRYNVASIWWLCAGIAGMREGPHKTTLKAAMQETEMVIFECTEQLLRKTNTRPEEASRSPALIHNPLLQNHVLPHLGHELMNTPPCPRLLQWCTPG